MTAGSHDREDLGILLSMAYLAWADRSLDERELALLREEAGDQGLSDGEVNELIAAMLTEAASISNISEALPTVEGKKGALFSAYVTALADHQLSMAELDAFDALCEGLGMSSEDATEIRQAAEREVRAVRAGDWEQPLFLERLLRPVAD